MYCQKCAAQNPEEAMFCRDCGFQFQKDDSIKCSSCGKLNSQKTRFCGECGKLLTGDLNNDISELSYRFYLNAPVVSKKTSFKLLIDKKTVFEGLLKDGFDFNYVVKKSKDHFHLIEIEIVKKGFSDFELKNFSQKINFDSIKGVLIEFEHHISFIPFMGDYFTIKQ